MRSLVLLNFFIALLYTASTVGFVKYESTALLLASSGLMIFWGGLALWNLASVFVFFGRYKFRAFYPIVSFVLAVALCLQGGRYTTQLMFAGTPGRPDSFLNEQTKVDLEKAARQVLGQSFKTISSDSSKRVQMIAGYPQKAVPIDTLNTLQKYGFRYMEVDDAQSLVTFNYYRLRADYRYTYTTNKQVTLGSRPPTITEDDIEDWSEVIRIANQGDHATSDEASRIVFCPSIVYPYLEQAIGKKQMDSLKGYSSERSISAEQKRLILDALNQQWPPSSHLIENPAVTYDSGEGMLHLGGSRMDDFWVVFLIKQLLSDKVLLYADDNCHLKTRDSLSPSEQNRIAWAQVGLMNFLYGNLFKKAEHFNDRPLGDGWYFAIK